MIPIRKAANATITASRMEYPRRRETGLVVTAISIGAS
jgi:hypothetical protein